MKEEPKKPAGPTRVPAVHLPREVVEDPGEAELDLLVERIDTEGVLKEGFTGQEM